MFIPTLNNVKKHPTSVGVSVGHSNPFKRVKIHPMVLLNTTAVDLAIPKSVSGLHTPHGQLVHKPEKCTVHKSWKCLYRSSVQEVSKSCKKCPVSKPVLQDCYITIRVPKMCPSLARNAEYPSQCYRTVIIIIITIKEYQRRVQWQV